MRRAPDSSVCDAVWREKQENKKQSEEVHDDGNVGSLG
jgi:hypothetical protein